MEVYVPSSEELVEAHHLFEKKESRWGDYWRAMRDVENAMAVGNLGDIARAVADFLKSWNWEYYRHMPADRRRAKLAALQPELEQLISERLQTIQQFRARWLASLQLADRRTVLSLFNAFEHVVRPVGTAKSLAVLAPNFFPLWDNPIAAGYGVLVGPRGYFLFMIVIKYQVSRFTLPDGLSPLKTLDEYNYCRFTRNWLPRASAATAGSQAPTSG
jgi:hypothetical protein